MLLFERDIVLPIIPGHVGLLGHLRTGICQLLPNDVTPLRIGITHVDQQGYHCEVSAISWEGRREPFDREAAFRLIRRDGERTDAFTGVLVVPTGMGAEIGGHAGDATPVARLLAKACDTLITHPNVVSASDLNEIPDNGLYVEGSVISRLLLGTVALQRVRSNRLLVVVEPHEASFFVNAAVNSVNAARSTYGLRCSDVVILDSPLKMEARYTHAGTAVGRIERCEALFELLTQESGTYDAVAVSSVVGVPEDYHLDYFRSKGRMVNPWGGVEAMLTHALSIYYQVPAAHAPMMESQKILNMNVGIVDPRMAAEAVSTTFLNCALKGLHRSPRIVTDLSAIGQMNTIAASDVSVVVVPDGCLGLPILAALEQGIPVIAVRENRTLMRNDLTALPWSKGQLEIVDNYWEAAGVMLALKAGLAPASVRRPMTSVGIRAVGRAMSDGRSNEQEGKLPSLG